MVEDDHGEKPDSMVVMTLEGERWVHDAKAKREVFGALLYILAVAMLVR